MQDVILDEMSEHQIKIEIAAIKAFAEEVDDRSLRIGTQVESLKDFLYQDVNVRLARVDERASNLLWVAGIAAAAVLAAWIQLLTMNGRLSAIEQQVKDINGSVQGIRLNQAAADPVNPTNIQEASLVLADARKTKTTIPTEAIKNAGEKFIDAAQNDPQALNAAISFVDYRSLINSNAIPKLTNGIKGSSYLPRVGSYLRTPRTGNDAADEAAGERAVEAQQALVYGPPVTENVAVMERMANPVDTSKGYQVIVYQIPNHPEAELVLDGLHMKNVIVKNMKIAYYGGATKLENVYFVNCTFSFPTPGTPTLDFARAILASPAVTFNRTA